MGGVGRGELPKEKEGCEAPTPARQRVAKQRTEEMRGAHRSGEGEGGERAGGGSLAPPTPAKHSHPLGLPFVRVREKLSYNFGPYLCF